MRLTICVALAAALAGCANTNGLSATEQRSGFSGDRVVTIPGHGNACTGAICTGVGLEWSAASPNFVILTAQIYNAWAPIAGASLSIDGRVVTLRAQPGITNFSPPRDPLRVSQRDFRVPLALVREIASSQRAWLRVQTSNGYLEDAIIDGPVDSKAYHAIGRFLAQVDRQ